MGLLKEFKDFAMRGNVVDLAVGVIMGAAFGKIVNSLVNDIIMPPIGAVISQGKFNFKDQFLDLRTIDPLVKEPVQIVKSLDEAQKLGVPVLAYGNFLTSIIDFTIMAFCIFLMVKLMSYLLKRQEEVPKPLPEDVELLREIRDLLKAGKAS